MTDALFDLEPTTPRWQELADLHGITCKQIEAGDFEDIDPAHWEASIDDFNAVRYEKAPTEREAVIALIHRLQLEGWKTVSV